MLDNKSLDISLMQALLELPLDEEASKFCDMPYQTKTALYDRKCKGCGFMRIEVGDMVCHSIEEVLPVAQLSGLGITRTCEYPGNSEIINGVEVFPSLTQIVMNTCKLWNEHNIES